jgi:predicted DCC family thiol-disulfide oxidoreductase YuxK
MAATPLLYDPDCGFCRVCVAVALSWDRRGQLRPVPLGSPEANDLLRGMP